MASRLEEIDLEIVALRQLSSAQNTRIKSLEERVQKLEEAMQVAQSNQFAFIQALHRLEPKPLRMPVFDQFDHGQS